MSGAVSPVVSARTTVPGGTGMTSSVAERPFKVSITNRPSTFPNVARALASAPQALA